MKTNSQGQALIIVIFGIALAISVISGSVITAVTLGKNARLTLDSQQATYAAETGLENALLKLIRNPNACNGSDSLTIGNSAVTINYTSSLPNCTISASATLGTVLKKIEVIATETNGKLTYCCWKEVP